MRQLLYLACVLGCHGKSAPMQTLPQPIQVKDTEGALQAEVRPLRPCRGSVGPVELIVGGPPLIAQMGVTRWSGAHGGSGTTLERDDQPLARVVADATSASVIDMHGVPIAHVAVAGTRATVVDAASSPLRTLRSEGPVIIVDQPALTITGTHDLILAALLASPELIPEVRIMAACERVLQ